MIKVINVLLLILSIVLGYFLVMGIVNPLKIQGQVAAREDAVHEKLLKIRDSQLAFRNATDAFAPNFDTLIQVIKEGEFKTVNRVSGDTLSVRIIDSLFKGDVAAVEDLPNVPNAKTTFKIDAGVLPSPSDSTLFVPVFEVSTNTNEFLSDLDTEFWEEDDKVKVGSITAPITSGNWE